MLGCWGVGVLGCWGVRYPRLLGEVGDIESFTLSPIIEQIYSLTGSNSSISSAGESTSSAASFAAASDSILVTVTRSIC